MLTPVRTWVRTQLEAKLRVKLPMCIDTVFLPKTRGVRCWPAIISHLHPPASLHPSPPEPSAVDVDDGCNHAKHAASERVESLLSHPSFPTSFL